MKNSKLTLLLAALAFVFGSACGPANNQDVLPLAFCSVADPSCPSAQTCYIDQTCSSDASGAVAACTPQGGDSLCHTVCGEGTCGPTQMCKQVWVNNTGGERKQMLLCFDAA